MDRPQPSQRSQSDGLTAKSIKQLATAWKSLLEYLDDEFNIDPEFTRHGIPAEQVRGSS
jgi:hypothetical protein